MKVSWFNTIVDSDRGEQSVRSRHVQIGRAADNDVVLDSPSIADHAVVCEAAEDGWKLVVLDGNSAAVGEEYIHRGMSRKLVPGEQIVLFPYRVTLQLDEVTPRAVRVQERLDEEMFEVIREVHWQLLEVDEKLLEEIYTLLDAQPRSNDPERDKQKLRQAITTLEKDLETIAARQGVNAPSKRQLLNHLTAHSLRSAILSELMEESVSEAESALVGHAVWGDLQTSAPAREEELEQIVEHVRRELQVQSKTDLSEKIELIERGFWGVWEQLQDRTQAEFKEYLAYRFLKRQLKDILFGLGPLEDLLRIPAISEIMVASSEKIYVERSGVVESTGRRFLSDAVTESIIQRIVGRVGRRIDRSMPLVDARLDDGSRVNAVIKPLAVSGPCITIRKFPARKLTVDHLIAKGALSDTVAKFLRACVINRKNIIIAGGTGTGKTTLLNCLSDYIPDKERIVTIEDTAELRLHKEHVIRMETKKASVEGTGEFTIRDLVKNALRMRPDRIVIGECRGPEALDMLQAMNTGHDGSLTTLHANSSEDVILRLEVLVQMAADLPTLAIDRQIASAVDLIVQLHRFSSGRRCVSQVTEVVGISPVDQSITLRDIFVLDEDDPAQSQIRPTGRLPTFMESLLTGKLLDLSTFYVKKGAAAE